jgi:hypothetical protein
MPQRLLQIVQKIFHREKRARYFVMKDVVADLKEVGHLRTYSQELEKQGLPPVVTRRTCKQIHWYLGCGLLNKGFLCHAKDAFRVADDEAPVALKTIDMCERCWTLSATKAAESSNTNSDATWASAGNGIDACQKKIQACPDGSNTSQGTVDNYVQEVVTALDSKDSAMKAKGLAVMWCLTRCNVDKFKLFENWNVLRASIFDLLRLEEDEMNSRTVNISIIGFASAIIVDYLFIHFFNREHFGSFCSNFVQKGMLSLSSRLMARTSSDEVCQFNFVTIFWRLIDHCLERQTDYRRMILNETEKIESIIQEAKNVWPYNAELNHRAEQVLSLIA